VGEHLPALPDEVLTALAGVDLIIHCGDLTVPGVLDDLEHVAPVVAVRGNHDDDAGYAGLPCCRVLRVAGRRIGVTHGTRHDAVEMTGGLLSLALRRTTLPGFHRAVRRRFGAVDAVVVGHIHMPVSCVRDGALLFSPGAVYVPECDPWFDWSTARARVYRRFRALAPPEALTPAVGMMEVTRSGIRAWRVPLREPLRRRGVGRAPGRGGGAGPQA
jgi:uncharacterized protein